MRLNPFAAFRDLREQISGLENPSVDLTAALIAYQDGTASSSVSLTPAKSLRMTAIYASVRVVAESIASLPMPVTRTDKSGQGREDARDDKRWTLFNGFPNPEMTGMELLETWIAHAMLWGNGYLYIRRNNAGQVIELWPLRPDETRPMRVPGSNQLYYRTVLADGTAKNLAAEDVIPLKSILSLSPIKVAREAIGAAVAAEEYAARFWSNNARPGGLIVLPENMDEDDYDEFKERWRSGHEGLKRAQLIGILTGGATWQEVGIAPGLAQFIETRQFGVREIARLFRVPPHMIGDLEGTVTRASIEQQSIEFVTYTLRPWIVRAEQALRAKVFTSAADVAGEVYPEFKVEGLMRGDIKSRYDAYAVGIQWGFLNRADPRRSEGLPLSDTDDDNLEEFLVPLNMISSKDLGKVLNNGGDMNGGDAGGVGLGDSARAARAELTPGSVALLSLILRNNPQISEDLATLAVHQLQTQEQARTEKWAEEERQAAIDELEAELASIAYRQKRERKQLELPAARDVPPDPEPPEAE